MAWRDFFVEHEGDQIAVRDYGGDGPPMMLLHGGGGTVAGWNELAAYLVPEFTVVGYDAPGHGHSDMPRTVDAEYSVHALEGVRKALRLESPILVGSSMGGATAIRYAARGGACSCIVAIDGAPTWRAGEQYREPVDRDAFRNELADAGWGGVYTAEEVDAAVQAAIAERGDAGVDPVADDQRRAHAPLPDGRFERRPTAEHIVAMRVVMDELPPGSEGIELFEQITVPVLLLNAERGFSPTGWTTDEQRARLDAVARERPNVTSEWIDAGHLIHWEKPRVVANRIREFVRDVRVGA